MNKSASALGKELAALSVKARKKRLGKKGVREEMRRRAQQRWAKVDKAA